MLEVCLVCDNHSITANSLSTSMSSMLTGSKLLEPYPFKVNTDILSSDINSLLNLFVPVFYILGAVNDIMCTINEKCE